MADSPAPNPLASLAMLDMLQVNLDLAGELETVYGALEPWAERIVDAARGTAAEPRAITELDRIRARRSELIATRGRLKSLLLLAQPVVGPTH